MPGPTFIDCDRLELTTAEEEDIEFLHEGVNHPDVRQYISAFRTPYSEDQYRDERWTTGDTERDVSVLAVPKDGEFAAEPIGTLSLSPLVERDGYGNFSLWFHPTAWGNGYALEAGAHLLEYGFRQHRLHRLSATVTAPNDASKRLCERLGFVREGTAREAQFADGGYVDVERYGLLVDEWDGPEEVLER